jgi:phosphohistidine phosphatase
MILYVVRHAAAADREAPKTDAERPLTDEGIARMKTVARGLARIGIVPAAIYTSPLLRARQTAAIVAKALGKGASVKDCDALSPGRDAAEVIEFLRRNPVESAAVVGHEPQLGDLVSLLVAGSAAPVVDMKKAAVSCIEFKGPPAAGKGTILWHLVPAVIEALLGK